MIVCLGTTPTIARTMEFAGVTQDGVNRAVAVREYAAGKAINAARAIATLGETVTCISPLGGATGERLRTLAAIAGTTPAVATIAAPTRLCVTVVDRAAGTSTELIEESGALTVEEGEKVLALLAVNLEGAKVCVLAGSLAPGLAADFYARCVKACGAGNVSTVLDASGAGLQAALAERPHYIKINAGELASIEPAGEDDEASIVAAATRVAARTGGWVVVTRGRSPTIAASATQAIRIDVPAVKVVSAIGSGDSFAGGLAVGIARGLPHEDAFRLATACASANAMTADAAHFDFASVERLRANVRTMRL